MNGRETAWEKCALCAEPLGELKDTAELHYSECAHWACIFRAVIGGANHILRKCSCFGGMLPADPPLLTRQESAAAAVKAWESTKPTATNRAKVARQIAAQDLHDPCQVQPKPQSQPNGPPTIWQVLEKPDDFPEEFVARAYNIFKQKTGETIHAHRLAKLRQLLRDRGLYRVEHMPNDDEGVIETWL